MNKENIFEYALDQNNLSGNRAHLEARLAKELAKDEKDRNLELIEYIETMIESVNYQLDNRGALNALPLINMIPVNPTMYPRFAKLVKSDGFQKALASPEAKDADQLSLSFSETQTEGDYPGVIGDLKIKLISSKKIKPGSIEEITERANKEKWPVRPTAWNSEKKDTDLNIVDASEIEEQKKKILEFLQGAKTLSELIAFAKDFQKKSSFYNTCSYDEVLNNVIGSIATEKDAPKDNIYLKLISDIVEPMFTGSADEALVAKAIWRLSTDLNIHQLTAEDILVSMIYRYSRYMSNDEVEAIKIQSECWKCLVFDPEIAIKSSELKGYFQSAGAFSNEREMLESLAILSDSIASRIFGDGEIEQIKAEKKIKFKLLVEESKSVPDEVKEFVKDNPPVKGEHPAKAGKNKNRRR